MIAIAIPAYQPDLSLLKLLQDLRCHTDSPIIVIDDGSRKECRGIFEQAGHLPDVTVLRHAINLGKGAALKTAFNHALCEWPDAAGLVTADADGQHLAEDILTVAARLDSLRDVLVLGARQFAGEVPLRSKLGNQITKFVMRIVAGQKLNDTQTGLRGVPGILLAAMLRIASNGYDFELDMLLVARTRKIPILEVPIQTVYIEQNRSSHFNPLTDSLKIYFTLLRFSAISAATTLIDNIVFYFFIQAGLVVWQAQLSARIVALLFNYRFVQTTVFHSKVEGHAIFARYLGLVAISGIASYTLLEMLHSVGGVSIMLAKITAELLLFFLNFIIQRDFIFTNRANDQSATNWDEYYKAVAPTAKLTRRYTARTLIGLILRFSNDIRPRIIEIGGANSCFVESIIAQTNPISYHVIDNNEYGLGLLRNRRLDLIGVTWSKGDVLNLQSKLQADIVYSIGLIEHFDMDRTAEAIRAHFRSVRDGGHVVISFPTPTWLYRLTRGAIETLGLWKFPDERPLERDEVARVMAEKGEIVWEKTLWPLVLTQHMIVARKRTKLGLLPTI